jgi:hypothetical protein
VNKILLSCLTFLLLLGNILIEEKNTLNNSLTKKESSKPILYLLIFFLLLFPRITCSLDIVSKLGTSVSFSKKGSSVRNLNILVSKHALESDQLPSWLKHLF